LIRPQVVFLSFLCEALEAKFSPLRKTPFSLRKSLYAIFPNGIKLDLEKLKTFKPFNKTENFL